MRQVNYLDTDLGRYLSMGARLGRGSHHQINLMKFTHYALSLSSQIFAHSLYYVNTSHHP